MSVNPIAKPSSNELDEIKSNINIILGQNWREEDRIKGKEISLGSLSLAEAEALIAAYTNAGWTAQLVQKEDKLSALFRL